MNKGQLIHSEFKNFKNNIREKGGIWASDNVYFTQFRDGFSATYKPNYPEHSSDDCAISYNWLNDQWRYITPSQYDAEYNKI